MIALALGSANPSGTIFLRGATTCHRCAGDCPHHGARPRCHQTGAARAERAAAEASAADCELRSAGCGHRVATVHVHALRAVLEATHAADRLDPDLAPAAARAAPPLDRSAAPPTPPPDLLRAL